MAYFMTAFLLVTGLVGVAAYLLSRRIIISEDHLAITANKRGFIKRILPAGAHVLRPGESIKLLLETKTKLTGGRAAAIATSDGIPVSLNWSGTYRLDPTLITDSRSQRLRGLPNAEKGIARNADLALRRLLGGLTVTQLFNPGIRDQIETQLNQAVIEKLKPLGIVLNGLNLQAIELPPEVSEALNKARALETLDGAIRRLDPATREVVRGVYQLDEVLHWDQYLPTPSRRTMKRLELAG